MSKALQLVTYTGGALPPEVVARMRERRALRVAMRDPARAAAIRDLARAEVKARALRDEAAEVPTCDASISLRDVARELKKARPWLSLGRCQLLAESLLKKLGGGTT